MVARTPSGSVKASARHAAEKRGHTMPGGSFPINNAGDLQNAKHDIGRAKNPAAARRWVNKRAHEMGEPGVGEKRGGKVNGRETMRRPDRRARKNGD
jgi:hypothetical protein